MFWLNTETAQACRHTEMDCNRQHSDRLFNFNLPIQNKLSWSSEMHLEAEGGAVLFCKDKKMSEKLQLD